MKLFLIIVQFQTRCDISGKVITYSINSEITSEFKDNLEILDNVFIIKTNLSSIDISKKIHETCKTGKYFISEINITNHDGWLNKEKWPLIRAWQELKKNELSTND